MSDIPNPIDSGVDGSQKSGEVMLATIVAPPMSTSSVADMVNGLLPEYSRSLGGDVASRMLLAHLRGLEHRLEEANNRAVDLSDKLEHANSEITSLKIEDARCKARLDMMSQTGKFKQAGIFFGTVLLGIGVDLIKNNLQVPALLVGSAGGALLIYVVLWPKQGRMS